MVAYKPSLKVRRFLKRVHAQQCGCLRPDSPHGACVNCSRYTSDRGAYIEPDTLRRRVTYYCDQCRRELVHRQAALRAKRTRTDWRDLSERPTRAIVVGSRMPDQYASKARDALRVFVSSGFSVAAVENVDVATLNQSIGALGLTREVYAESRDGETVLRRIGEAVS